MLRYFDHVFPVRPGTEDLPLAELVDRQHYRLAHWRVGDEELNYRRFFDIDTLAALRQEDPAVFEATHALLIDLVRDGAVDGLRIDHPDGLADPRGYLTASPRRPATGRGWSSRRSSAADEDLPEDWATAGTTGYDSVRLINGVFHDGTGTQLLTALAEEVAGEREDWPTAAMTAKREVIEGGQYADVHHLVDLLVDICALDPALRDHTRRDLHDSVVEVLVAFDRYRAYVVAGEPPSPEAEAVVDAAVEAARLLLPDDQHDALDLVRDLVLGLEVGDPELLTPRARRLRADLVTRFQQTCGPVMAKGVEDTAAYRWVRLVSLNEVGGDPGALGLSPEELHAFASSALQRYPTGMTTLSTHDTKRSEDVRARLAVVSEVPQDWADTLRMLREACAAYRSPEVDGRIELLIWQTLVGTWPITQERLGRYVEKVMREAKLHSSWTTPDAAYESAVQDFVTALLVDPEVTRLLSEWTERTADAVRATTLGQKLLQLVLPGVPDVFQGCESLVLTLVDPDNRQPVDHADLAARLASLDRSDGTGSRALGALGARSLADTKLLVTSRVLRLRREHPEWFTGADATYAPVATTSGSALAVSRGDGAGPGAIAVMTRLSLSLKRFGGWAEHTVTLPESEAGWTDELTGRVVSGGPQRLAELLADLPVALLRR